MTTTISLADRLAGSAWGLLVGDAMGVPYEFQPASSIGEVRWGKRGTWHKPAGTWSDDGALMLALLDSLLSAGFDLEDQGLRAVAWMRDGAYTPGLEGRFDIGGTTSAALSAIAAGAPAATAGPADDRACGNGSLMRILPVALAGRDLPDGILVEHATRASCVTHGHPRCQVACALYVLVVARLLHGTEPSRALAEAREALRALAPEPAALAELENWPKRTGSGFVLDSFWSAWDAFAAAANYEDAIVAAIRYGNDTDTTAAIAGGLAGARFGWTGIPVAWRSGMRDGGVAAPLIDRLVETTGARTSRSHPLRVDDVPVDDLGAAGRLGITFLPGKKRDGWTGPHWRDLHADAARLAGGGADALLLLNEDVELDYCAVPDVVEVVEAAGVPVIRFPIEDPRIPTDHDAYAAVVGDLAGRIRAGESIVVACRGGIDRSGMTAAALLVALGSPLETAITRVRRHRHGALTQPEQLAYLHARWDR